GSVTARTAAMNSMRHQFLARAGFTGNEHSRVGGSYLFDFEEHVFGGVTAADDLVIVVSEFDLFLQVNILFLKLILQLADFAERATQLFLGLLPLAKIHKRADHFES